MTFKTLLFSFTLVVGFSAQAAVKNLCDDMIASGKSTDEQIKKCLAKMGESDTYKENQQKKKWQTDANADKAAKEAAKKANIEVKKFSLDELTEAGFGKLFFAVRIDWSNKYKTKEKKLTEGDALCKYLGYEKALKSIYSPEIKPRNANKNGLVIDTNFFGVVSKEPELFTDKDKYELYTVRSYNEITCAKVISDKVEGTAAELEKVVEDIVAYNDPDDGINAPKKSDKDSAQNDGPRKPAGKTDNGYKKPEWANDAPSEGGVVGK